jgi:hypothetical protein
MRWVLWVNYEVGVVLLSVRNGALTDGRPSSLVGSALSQCVVGEKKSYQ